MSGKLFLDFKLGKDRYALDCAQIVEVLPLLRIKQVPRAPAGVAGACNYRGEAMPVIDLTQLTAGCPAPLHLSTRIVVVRYADRNGAEHPLGLLVEKATEIVWRDPAQFSEPGIVSNEAPYLGPVVADRNELVQSIDVARLLPAALRDVLFRAPVASP